MSINMSSINMSSINYIVNLYDLDRCLPEIK